uniref:Transmembrane protein 241 n=1 Tax=Pseudonaja textilis TaxID=8673 RepID=A0A670YIJ6_PSETE
LMVIEVFVLVIEHVWQTLVGGILLHVSWKIGWVEISSSSRSEVLSWLPASALFVGIIYSGSRALSRLVRYSNSIWHAFLLMFYCKCHTSLLHKQYTVSNSISNFQFCRKSVQFDCKF